MSGTAWLAARQAGYLGGWQTLLDSDCVCVYVSVLHHSVPTPGLCTWPVVRALPPSFYLPRKEQPRRQPAQKEFPEQRGILTWRQAHRGSLCLSLAVNHWASLALEVPRHQWKTEWTIVHLVAIWKREVTAPLESIFKAGLLTDHQLLVFLSLFSACVFILTLCDNVADWVSVLY